MRKKLLFTINTMGRGGAEAAVIPLMRELIPYCDISLYVMTGQGELIDRIPSGVKLLNRRYDRSDVLSKSGKARLYRHTFFRLLTSFSWVYNLPYIISNFMAMRKTGKLYPDKLLWKPIADAAPVPKDEYDAVIAFTEGAATYYAARKVKARTRISFFHTDYMMSGYTRELDGDCFGRIDRIFCVSDDTRKAFLSVYPEYADKTDVLRNLIDVEGIKHRAKEGKGFDDSYTGIRIITLGRLVKLKAIDKSVEALSVLKQRGIDARWYVFGEGEERAHLEKLIDKLGLSDSFFLPGVTGDPYPYLAQSDIYVQCSQFEGQSIAIREAQVLGLAAILSESCRGRSDIDEGRDCLLAASDAGAIADAIEFLIKNEDMRKRIGENAARKQQNFDDIEKLFDLLEVEHE